MHPVQSTGPFPWLQADVENPPAPPDLQAVDETIDYGMSARDIARLLEDLGLFERVGWGQWL